MENEHIIYKIKAYLELNNSGSIDTREPSVLEISQEGDSYNITTWNINLPKPTQSQLDDNDNLTRAHLLLSRSSYVNDRRINYPAIGDQLDMLYHELETTGSVSTSGSWFQFIKNIKDSYPKV